MRTLLVWVPLWILIGLPLAVTIAVLYLILWGDGDWHFRPRWVWLGLLIGAPLLVPPTWQYQDGWAWWSEVAWGFGVGYLLILMSLVGTLIILLVVMLLARLVELRGGKQGIYRDMRTVGGAAKFVARPITKPTYGFARLLYHYGHTFHTKICPRVQFMQPEVWEEE